MVHDQAFAPDGRLRSPELSLVAVQGVHVRVQLVPLLIPAPRHGSPTEEQEKSIVSDVSLIATWHGKHTKDCR